MPIVHFINCKTHTAGKMKAVLGYVSKEKKTKYEDRRFVSGVNCSPQTAYEEMKNTKQLHGKTGGRLYYHLVQSFPKGYDIKPEIAHQIALEFAERAFKDYECVVATHIDREHIHSHIVFNSVSFQTGNKYHSNKDSVLKLMQLSDEICSQYGIGTLDDPKKKMKENRVTVMSDREYRSAVKGESVKLRLIYSITESMKQAKSKKHFCFLMKKSYGVDVRWDDNRKNITYTLPSGYKIRDKRLHDKKFLKEMMEYEFKIRYAIFNGEEQSAAERSSRDITNGGSAGAELDSGAEGIEFDMSVTGRGSKRTKRTADHSTNDEIRTEPSNVVQPLPDGERAAGTDDKDNAERYEQRTHETGWEPERRVLISNERAREMAAETKLKAVQNSDSLAANTIDFVDDIAVLSTLIEDSDEDEDEYYSYADRKVLEREREKKESLGMYMG